MINLEIVSPSLNILENIIWLELNSPAGNIVIQPGHTPMFISVLDGESFVYCLENGKQKNIKIEDGFLSFDNNQACLIGQKIELI